MPKKGIVDRELKASYNFKSRREVVTSRCSWMMVVLPAYKQSAEIIYMEEAIIGGDN
jgi:hypothetical protein